MGKDAEQSSSLSEEIAVLFHAALLGRADIVQQVLGGIRNNLGGNEESFRAAISVGNWKIIDIYRILI